MEADTQQNVLEAGTYEVIRKRLDQRAAELEEKLAKLNASRKQVFGAAPTALVTTDRISTKNNCIPRDIDSIGNGRFLFGFNVFLGLRNQTEIADVFAAYEYKDGAFKELGLDLISDARFEADFKALYKFYKDTVFSKFSKIGPHFFMVFQVGKSITDIKTFKWQLQDGQLTYLGNRSDHEFQYPPQHEFEWTRTHRDLHRKGKHPHISIQDRLFVETVGGDLTIKIEDNTETGQGIYSEPVDHVDQTLDDAEIFYSLVDKLILLKIRPYQEKEFRFFVYNEKLQEVRRIDAIRDACVLLPEGHGIMFANGYYLQLGTYKDFPSNLSGMMFERKIASPNGEDHLYVFYQPVSGTYVLMPYNVIEQRVENPLVCHGFSLFEDGEVALFKAESEEPTRHHVVQVWQTPFLDHNVPDKTTGDSYLAKIGNPAVVRCMAECRELLTLLRKEDTFGGLYGDLAKRAGAILDSYFWLEHQEAFQLKTTLGEVRNAASAAIDEYEKVARLRKHAREEFSKAAERVKTALDTAAKSRFESVNDFVALLSSVRGLRGDLIALKEVRYMDVAAVDGLEKEVIAATENVSGQCIKFLLSDTALDPYRERIKGHDTAAKELKSVAEGKKLDEQALQTGKDLEMLIDVVSNLKIDDATQTTKIVEAISGVYAPLNQAKSAIKARMRDLRQVESATEFNAQMYLLDQNVINYLDLCDSAERCDELMTRVMMHVEELEGRFSEFDEYVARLTEKREEVLNTFEARKQALNESRAKKINGLVAAADRILNGMRRRVEQFKTLPEIHTYFASDMMAARVREVASQLEELKDPVKAGELQTRLKTIREDAVRQLKDRAELFVDGSNIIQFGKHKFSVNHQPLELTVVQREEKLCAHLVGTNLYIELAEPELERAKDLWSQELPSESASIYRGEYLAYRFIEALRGGEVIEGLVWSELTGGEDFLPAIQHFMRARYSERYVKGVHDVDAALLTQTLVEMEKQLGILRFDPASRALALWFWRCRGKDLAVFEAKVRVVALRRSAFGTQRCPESYIAELAGYIAEFQTSVGLFPHVTPRVAAEYLSAELSENEFGFARSRDAETVIVRVREAALSRGFADRFAHALKAVENDYKAPLEISLDWVASSHELSEGGTLERDLLLEAAVGLLFEGNAPARILEAQTEKVVQGFQGAHPLINEGRYSLRYYSFQNKLQSYERDTLPLFARFTVTKHAILERLRKELKIDEFKTQVLSSFVRNKLLDEVFLPLVGANLAKQIGVAGDETRTDRMGMLLLVSPPGYGKTTLMEYVANRLGITFVKVNGPAIGHDVRSLDPSECRSASAREEVEKLNLAFEMGDNVMIYLDDIQHCSPELLQKFISLCDGQRKIEGVFNGQARTYNLRGRKVAVVMAGNPYTESGDRFQIPDMLANRADTYNLGDMVGGHEQAFKLSYVENSLTSNSILAPIATRSRKDLYAMIRIAETGSREGAEFETSISTEQIDECVNVLKKLLRVRDVLLKVNQMYIESAAQADAYRTEPPFKLQGSYRNMSKMADKILPVMNDEELERLIEGHYRNEAQTLTTGAEANLLKWRELLGKLSPEELARWEEIKKTFRRNKLFGAGDQDPVGRLVVQLSTFKDGLDAIREALVKAAETGNKQAVFRLIDPESKSDVEETAISTETLSRIWELVAEERKAREEKEEEP